MSILAKILEMAGRYESIVLWLLGNFPPIVDQLSVLSIFFS